MTMLISPPQESFHQQYFLHQTISLLHRCLPPADSSIEKRKEMFVSPSATDITSCPGSWFPGCPYCLPFPALSSSSSRMVLRSLLHNWHCPLQFHHHVACLGLIPKRIGSSSQYRRHHQFPHKWFCRQAILIYQKVIRQRLRQNIFIK